MIEKSGVENSWVEMSSQSLGLKPGVEKSGIRKFMVEKSGVEMSRVEKSGVGKFKVEKFRVDGSVIEAWGKVIYTKYSKQFK